MGRTKFRFRRVPERHPAFHAATTSHQWIVRAADVAKVFRRYRDQVNLKTPRYILNEMSQRNGCLLQPGEFASTSQSDITSPEFNLSPEMSSQGRRSPGMKRIKLSFGDSSKSESLQTEYSSTRQSLSVVPSRRVSCTISKAPDSVPSSSTMSEAATDLVPTDSSMTATHLVPTSLEMSQECTSAETSSPTTVPKKIECRIKRSGLDIRPVYELFPEHVFDAERAKKLEAGSLTKEFEIQLPQMRVEKEMPQPAKRLKRLKSVDDSSKLVSPVKKSKTSTHSTDDDKMDTSPNKDVKVSDSPSKYPSKGSKLPVRPIKDEKKVPKPAKRLEPFEKLADIPGPVKKSKTSTHSTDDDKMDTSNKDVKMSDSPSKHRESAAVSPDKSESTSESVSPFSSIPTVDGDEIEMEFSCLSEDSPIPSYTASFEEIENLVDDPSTVESIRKVVDDLINDSILLTETKGNFSPSKKKKKKSPRKISSPSQHVRDISCPVAPSGLVANPKVMAYLRQRFESVSSYRGRCMGEIKSFYELFRADVSFLYSYSTSILTSVRDIPIDIVPSGNARNLKRRMMRNARELSRRLAPIMTTVETLLLFWDRGLRKIEKLNSKFKPFLSTEGSPITMEFLRKYESCLRTIWEKMDRKVLVEDNLISSLMAISNDYLKLTKEFPIYLVTLNVIRPTPTAEDVRIARIRRT